MGIICTSKIRLLYDREGEISISYHICHSFSTTMLATLRLEWDVEGETLLVSGESLLHFFCVD